MATTPNSTILPQKPNFGFGGTILAANTAKDGTGTVVTVFTAGADGAQVDGLNIMPLGTNVATVMRVFANNGMTNATAANNSFLFDVTLPATTNSETAGLGNIFVPMDMRLPAGAKINVTLGTAVAAGFAVSGRGGDL